jgi:hypothetical protein
MRINLSRETKTPPKDSTESARKRYARLILGAVEKCVKNARNVGMFKSSRDYTEPTERPRPLQPRWRHGEPADPDTA